MSVDDAGTTGRAQTIRAVVADDVPALMMLLEAIGLFAAPELDELRGMIDGFAQGAAGADRWLLDDDEGFRGVAYYAPERMTEGTWNLYLIAVHPDVRRQGRGAALLRHVETALARQGERLLLVETSGLTSFAATRDFYRACGYEQEARIRDFYRAGDDKIVFRKALS